MKTPPRRIPIAAARRYGQEYGQQQVLILSFGPDGVTHLVTWGSTKKDCQQATEGIQRVAKILGMEKK